MAELAGRRLLVLGAGRHQVPLIRRAVERGAEVVTSDYLPDAPGRAFATHPVTGDALDPAVNIAIAREHEVDAVTTIGTDQAMVAVATVARELGLPCHVTVEAAIAATNKVPMRAALAAAGVAVPQVATVARDEPTPTVDSWPVVVKPSDGQGQRATVRVEHPADLRAALRAAWDASRSGVAVVEGFVVGPEATASAWLTDGTVHLVGVADRLTYNPGRSLGIALRHTTPSAVVEDRLDDVGTLLGRVATAYGMTDGPLYVQFIAPPGGDLVVMEAAARVGGGHEPQLYRRTTGVDLVDLSLDLAVSGRASPEWPAEPPAAAGAVTFVVARPGRFASTSDIEALVADGVVAEGAWYRGPGHEQERVADGQGRVGYLLVTGDDRGEVARRSAAAYARLRITDVHGDELVYWPDGPALLDPSA